jgi:TPR repeat protein
MYGTSGASRGWHYARSRSRVSGFDTKAVELISRAADQGYAEAQTKLGAAFLEDRGVPRYPAVAAAWFRKAGK